MEILSTTDLHKFLGSTIFVSGVYLFEVVLKIQILNLRYRN